ncbi:c-type cytochrome [Mangrovicella endophytica]|uniref:c-type cytochrome n=1 Tax=Mangrovicella endophytica TaxID=2066697 RepID=UPI0018E46DD2|nr:c-type cytochrome [Mangrovicella endophytica]
MRIRDILKVDFDQLGNEIVVVILVLIGGITIFVWAGYYNVAASEKHLGITNWILATVRDQSIAARSSEIEVPDLKDRDRIRLGAQHYVAGCAFCHGIPGEPISPIAQRMLPAPPDLANPVNEYDAADHFIIIRSGLKYTGMPAWPGVGRDDEVWSVVAFVEWLQDTGGADRRDVIDDAGPEQRTGGGYTNPEAGEAYALSNCVRCHGDADTAPVSRLVPALSSQSPDYLRRSLQEYRNGRRQSGFMQPVSANLTDGEINQLVDYYSGLAPVETTSPEMPEAASIARGRAIAAAGIPKQEVAPCSSCHAGAASLQYGIIDGLGQRYLAGQLDLWRKGHRTGSDFGIIMARSAANMTDEQIRDVSAYYASLTRDLSRFARSSPAGATE